MPRPDDDFARKVRTLAHFAQCEQATPAHLTAAAALLRDRRPEPQLRTLVAEAMQADRVLRTRYALPMRLLIDGIPAHEDADEHPVPARPGFGDKGPSHVTLERLQDLLDAVCDYSAATKLGRAAARGRQRPSGDPDAQGPGTQQRPSYDPDAHGRGAMRTMRCGLRRFFRREAVRRWWADGDPTRDLQVRPGGASHAAHITLAQFYDWLEVACTTGRDPELDRLLVLFILLTALRREALLNLTLDAIDVGGGCVRASAKYGKIQLLPVNRHLLEEIVRLARARGARHGWDAAFRYRDGHPLTRRHFNALSDRLKRHCAWAAPLTIGPHAIRRLLLTQIEQRHGGAAATAWAGHSWQSRPTLFHYLAEPGPEQLRAVAADLFGPPDAPLPPGSSPARAFSVPYGIPPVREPANLLRPPAGCAMPDHPAFPPQSHRVPGPRQPSPSREDRQPAGHTATSSGPPTDRGTAPVLPLFRASDGDRP